MTISVTKQHIAVVSGPGPGVHVTKQHIAVVSGPGPGVHVTNIAMCVVIDTTPSNGWRPRVTIC